LRAETRKWQDSDWCSQWTSIGSQPSDVSVYAIEDLNDAAIARH